MASLRRHRTARYWERWHLTCDQPEDTIEGAEVMCFGKLLHIRASATRKALSLTVDSRMRWRWGGMQSLSLDVCHLTKFIDEVRRCRPMKTFILKVGTLESNLLRNLQPVKLAEKRSDVVKARRWKDESSSNVHHCLEPWWDAGQCCVTVVQPEDEDARTLISFLMLSNQVFLGRLVSSVSSDIYCWTQSVSVIVTFNTSKPHQSASLIINLTSYYHSNYLCKLAMFIDHNRGWYKVNHLQLAKTFLVAVLRRICSCFAGRLKLAQQVANLPHRQTDQHRHTYTAKHIITDMQPCH